ncbi:MAG TPA: polysaccharide deacetylase family protein [Nitrospira sp.]|nr:polysaccharide deacetylase family protein [Nitrospira sp.]
MMTPERACYLSIDLEDYKHATMLDMGLEPRTNPEQTWRGVNRILAVLRETDSHPALTLFTTGQVARSQPDLVREMAAQGHEIGCHSDQHENVYTLTRSGFLHNLLRAKDSLETAGGQRVVGFRAPNFSIDDRTSWAYPVLAEAGFTYDSSVASSRRRTTAEPYDVLRLPEGELVEFPIYRHVLAGNQGIRVIGGTYFRLLPLELIVMLMKKSASLGYVPLIYLHAADADEQPSPVSWNEMSRLPYLSRCAWSLRQQQWLVGAQSVADKLRAILALFPHQGPMHRALPTHAAVR